MRDNERSLYFKIGLGCLVILLVVGFGCAVFWLTGNEKAELDFPMPVKDIQEEELPGAVVAVRPQILKIPVLAVMAPVVPLGINERGEFDIPPTGDDVGWYLAGGYPGSGNSEQAILLDGHLTDMQGKPAVFLNLNTLKKGDRLQIIREDGKTFNYLVQDVFAQPWDEVDMAEMMRSVDPAKEGVNIVTCAGVYDYAEQNYQQRLIVRAVAE